MELPLPEYRALLEGYHRFRAQQYVTQKRRWEHLATGQEPPIMIIACCDSRVDPAVIFDIEPGQAFVLRNVANLVPPFETGGGLHGASAAIEFGVTQLNVRHLVVMGHGACGGVAAALRQDRKFEGTFIDGWIALLDGAREKVMIADPADPQLAMEEEGVRTSLANLRTFPFVTEREAAAKLSLHGCHFSIIRGQLSLLDEAENFFRPA